MYIPLLLMETRTIYEVMEYRNVYAKDDVNKECPEDHTQHTIGVYKTLKGAEAFAKKYSMKELDFPLIVEESHQQRGTPESGYVWKEGMGWEVEDYDHDVKVRSEWWKGEHVHQQLNEKECWICHPELSGKGHICHDGSYCKHSQKSCMSCTWDCVSGLRS